jgi:hypothetical protein
MNCKTCNEPAPQFELVGGECIRCVVRERDRYRVSMALVAEALEELMTVASECQDFDQENQVPYFGCCGMELDEHAKGHQHGCVANAVLGQVNALTLARTLAPRPVDKPPADELVCQPAATATTTQA